MIKKILWFIGAILGIGSIETNTCWFSKHFWNVHDYHKHKGGDGYPYHFYEYTCLKCGQKFEI